MGYGFGFGTWRRRGSGREVLALPQWAAARDGVRAGTRNARIVCVGNSKTRGVSEQTSNQHNMSYPKYLSDLIGATVPSRYSNVFGDGGISDYGAFDTSVSIGDGWHLADTGTLTVGGKSFNNTTTNSSLYFAAAGEADVFDVYWPRNSGLGSLSVSVDGGSATTINLSGASAIMSTTINVPAGTGHVLAAARVSGNVHIIGVASRLSTQKTVEVYNCGWGSSTTTNIVDASSAWRSLNALKYLAADLMIIAADTNDYTPAYGPVPLPTYRANMDTLIAAGKLSGSVLVLSEFPSAISRQTLEVQLQYREQGRLAAAAAGVPYLDMATALTGGSYETAPPGTYADATHPTASAYLLQAQWLAPYLLSAI